jgi:diaminohydroxyphosphoribosylaminopyrimidine deaminase/5-amino-6-(5-phosphoribosylamino)uracil reductase
MQLNPWMLEALHLAERGRLGVRSNPVVGAVIVKHRKIIARGYHARYGGPHAEVIALKKAAHRAKGATLYVTLEPCSTFGKTPPCTDLILKSGIKEIVIGAQDPTRENGHKSISIFNKAGIRVKTNAAPKEVQNQNRAFFYFHKYHKPYVILKLAQSLDGKIATRTGDSRWISSRVARQRVHALRAQVGAVVIGKRTLMRDNARLTVRDMKCLHQPLRVVISNDLKFPKNLKLFKSTQMGPVLIVTRGREKSLIEKRGTASCWVMKISGHKKQVDLKRFLQRLAKLHVTSVLVEGGGELAASFLKEKLVNEIQWFVAKKIIGGKSAVTSVEGEGVAWAKQAIRVRDTRVEDLGDDLLIKGYL